MNTIAPHQRLDSAAALQRGVKALLRHQAPDGSWEGEMVWCPMLAAQYVLMRQITQTEISPQEREALLQQFQVTRSPEHLWGIHEQSPPYLFITGLVYVVARVLGVERDDPLLASAYQFIRRQGGILEIPSWGKFWLAMFNLYDWQGVNPVLPEVWILPQWLPIHPANYYCHTRLIYAGMAYIYGCKFQTPVTPLIEQLRSELYLQPYSETSFTSARSMLRQAEVYSPPGWILRRFYDLAAFYDRWRLPQLRRQSLLQLIDHIRFEFHTTDHTCISAVSGLINLIALWRNNPQDDDFRKGLENLSRWMWRDEEYGLRIVGARTSTWDTSLQFRLCKR